MFHRARRSEGSSPLAHMMLLASDTAILSTDGGWGRAVPLAIRRGGRT